MYNQSLVLDHGTTYPNNLPITNKDGTPYDLTGASLWLTIKRRGDRRADDTAALAQLTLGAGLTVASPTTGVIAVKLTDEQVDAISPGLYRYDVKLAKGGDEFRPIGGRLVIVRGTTAA